MSQEPDQTNRGINQINPSNKQCFSTALFLNFSQYSNAENFGIKDLTDEMETLRMSGGIESLRGRESLRISGECFPTPNITPRQSDAFMNFITSDLLKKIEEGSPISKRHSDLYRKTSDFLILNCETEDSPEFKEGRNFKLIHQSDSDITSGKEETNETNEDMIYKLNNFNTKNYKLKSSLEGNKLVNLSKQDLNNEVIEGVGNKNKTINEKYEEPKSLFEYSMTFGATKVSNDECISPCIKVDKKDGDSSPIFSYFDGTPKYISQAFFNEFKKNDKIFVRKNGIEKKDEVKQDEEELINTNGKNPDENEIYYDETGTLPSDQFNCLKSFQLPFTILNNEITKSNMFKNNLDFINSINNSNSYNINNNRYNNNILDLKSTNNDKRNNAERYKLGKIENSTTSSIKRGINKNKIDNTSNNMNNLNTINNLINNDVNCSSNQSTQANVNFDEYSVEMFGRRGWICEMCNNFNYDTRQKCNRCGVNKTPKKINKKNVVSQVVTDSSVNSNEANDDLNNSADKKKKKSFVERVGDWVCIKCKNLNFSFRVICNRCQLPKAENDKMFENYMNNLKNYAKGNEMMQNRMLFSQNQFFTFPQINFNNNYWNNVNNYNCYNYNSKSKSDESSHNFQFGKYINGVNCNSGLSSMGNMSNVGNMSNMGNVGINHINGNNEGQVRLDINPQDDFYDDNI